MTEQNLQIFVANDPGFMENSYTLYYSDGGPCWVVDPGLPPQAELILAHVKEKGLQPQAILLTHGHADHIAGVDELRADWGQIPVYLAEEEWDTLSNPRANLSALFGDGLVTEVAAPKPLPADSTLTLDASTWQILDTSGHSPGGRSFYSAEAGVVIVGDALFAGSVGRVDFPNSNGAQLIRNIHEQLMTLPDETRVLSGHGPETTVGRERAHNPYVRNGI